MRILSIANNYTSFKKTNDELSSIIGLKSDYHDIHDTSEAQKRYHLAVAKIEHSGMVIKEKANNILNKSKECKKEMMELYKEGLSIQKDAKHLYKTMRPFKDYSDGEHQNRTIKIKHSPEDEMPKTVSIQKYSEDGKLKIDMDYGNYQTIIREFDQDEKPKRVYRFIGGTLRDARVISENKITGFTYTHNGDLSTYKDKEKEIEFSSENTGKYQITEKNQSKYPNNISTTKIFDFGSKLSLYSSETRSNDILLKERMVFENQKLNSYSQSTQTWSQLEYDCKFNNGELIKYTKKINTRPIVEYNKDGNTITLKQLYSCISECIPYYEVFSAKNGVLQNIKKSAMKI